MVTNLLGLNGFLNWMLVSLFFVTISFTSGELTSPEVESIKQLYNISLWNYNTKLRPRLNQSDAVVVNVSFHPTSFVSFDTTEQTFVSVGFFQLTWMDEFVGWEPSAYFGTRHLLVDIDKMWRPNLGYFKAFDGDGTIGKESMHLLHVLNTGQVQWYPTQLFSTMCDVSVKYYPFDKQVCLLYINDGNLSNDKLTFNVSPETLFQIVAPHAEWDLESVTAEKQVHYNNALIVITFRLQRRPSLAVYSLIAPLLVMGILNVCLFLLPVTSGEKCSVAITLFLSYGVLMVATSDIMPANSLEISLLIMYVFVLLVLSGFTVIFCIIESRVHSAYGQSRISAPRLPRLRVKGKVTKVHVIAPTEPQTKTDTMEDNVLESERPSVRVEDLLSWLDTAMFVVALVAGLTYTIVVLMTLKSN